MLSDSKALSVNQFDDRFIGEISLRDYAEEVFSEYENCPEHLREYIDMDAYARDLESSGAYVARND